MWLLNPKRQSEFLNKDSLFLQKISTCRFRFEYRLGLKCFICRFALLCTIRASKATSISILFINETLLKPSTGLSLTRRRKNCRILYRLAEAGVFSYGFISRIQRAPLDCNESNEDVLPDDVTDLILFLLQITHCPLETRKMYSFEEISPDRCLEEILEAGMFTMSACSRKAVDPFSNTGGRFIEFVFQFQSRTELCAESIVTNVSRMTDLLISLYTYVD